MLNAHTRVKRDTLGAAVRLTMGKGVASCGLLHDAGTACCRATERLLGAGFDRSEKGPSVSLHLLLLHREGEAGAHSRTRFERVFPFLVTSTPSSEVESKFG